MPPTRLRVGACETCAAPLYGNGGRIRFCSRLCRLRRHNARVWVPKWLRVVAIVLFLLACAGRASAQTCVIQTTTTPLTAVLTWTNPTAPAFASAVVQRATAPTGPWTQLGSPLPVPAATYTDTTIQIGVTYYYQILAQYSGGTSGPSNVVCKAILPPISGVSVALIGTGQGTVTSNPAGIACPSTCAAFFTPGLRVSLAAKQRPNSRFAGWSGGGCSGTGGCAVTVTLGQYVFVSALMVKK